MTTIAKRQIAFSLIEIMVSMVIFAVATVAFVSALIYGGRTSYLAAQEVAAANFAMTLIEQMRIRCTNLNDYDALGDPNATQANSFIGNHTTPIVPGDPSASVFTANVRFKGFGMVSSSTNSAMTATIPTGFPDWIVDEFVGGTVMIKEGRGSGQIARITANTANTLSINRNLTGAGSSGWQSNPDNTSYFEINGGKTVEINVSWSFKEKTYTRSFRTLLYLEN